MLTPWVSPRSFSITGPHENLNPICEGFKKGGDSEIILHRFRMDDNPNCLFQGKFNQGNFQRREGNIWKIEGKSIKLQPKNCQEIINVETGGYDTVTCNEKHGIEIKITDNLYEFEKTIDGNATTFLMARYK